MTNVIRHSRATECFITLSDGDAVTLTVTNNGVTAAPGEAEASGSGLAGMSARLASVGGRLEHRQVEDRFTVEASVPARLSVGGLG